MAVARIAAEHGDNALHAVAVACQLITPLNVVYGIAVYLVLTFPDENLADFFEYRHHDIVEEMMPLYEQICRLWRNAQSFQFILQPFPALLRFGILALKLRHLSPDLVS